MMEVSINQSVENNTQERLSLIKQAAEKLKLADEVSTEDVAAWLLAVTQKTPGHRGISKYVTEYRVIDKVRKAKTDPEKWLQIKSRALLFAETWAGKGHSAKILMQLVTKAFEPSIREAMMATAKRESAE